MGMFWGGPWDGGDAAARVQDADRRPIVTRRRATCILVDRNPRVPLAYSLDMDDQQSNPESDASPQRELSEAEAMPPESTGQLESPAPTLKKRVVSIDVLRGVAVLGILAMNIYAFAMPFQAYTNPLLGGGQDRASMATWFFTHLAFDQKFMPVFSMLFGAGLVLMWQRAGERPMGSLWFRRQFWLLVMGALHGYFLWFGDILANYAVLGMAIYPLRRATPRTLLMVGTLLLLLGMPISTVMGYHAADMASTARSLEARQEAGKPMSDKGRKLVAQWQQMRPMMAPTEEDIERNIEVHRGGYWQIVQHRAPMTLMMQTSGLFFIGIWRMGALMLIGMALMKLGVFSAARSDVFYRRLAAIGYGVGLPVVVVSCFQLAENRWDALYMQQQGLHWNTVGGVLVALGHVAIVMLICRHRRWPSLQARLEAVGRMALSNYLLHSIVLTMVFYGYGLGLYGQVDRPLQLVFVAAMWALQLWWSPLWLGRWRFGPAEWLWRSLTYRRRQPMRRV